MMKPGKLYLKIFLSFVMILIVTELLIFGLFMVTAGQIFQDRFEFYTKAKVLVTRELVKEKMSPGTEKIPSGPNPLIKLMRYLGDTYDATVWLADENRKPVVKSFSGEIPEEIIHFIRQEDALQREITDYHHYYIGWMSYTVIPIKLAKDRPGSLHIFFESPQTGHTKTPFAVGLVIIGFIVALLVYVVSRRITAPIKQLKDSTLRIANGDLSHRVDVCSRDEIGDLGRSFNHMTDKLDKMIQSGRELTAHVSHELRSPLARIRITEELLKDGLKEGNHNDLDRHFETMEQDIEQLDHLIGRILAFSKLDIQQTSLPHRPVKLADLLGTLVKQHIPIIDQKRLRITTDVSPSAVISGDQELLGMAFSNIIDNAIKFTPENGCVLIKLHLAKDGIHFKTTNDTRTLHRADLDQIFEPFYRTKNTPAAGYGLGLAIAKKIIDMHKGTIVARHRSGNFEIRIHFPASP
jgi:two-component system sensor histidine kinase CpxA